MAIQTLSALAVRVTGIFMGLSALKTGASYGSAFTQANQDPWLFVSLTGSVMMAGAALCMIFFPRTIAAKFVPVVPNESTDPPAAGQLEMAGCALLGLYFLVQVALDAAWMISYYFASVQWNTPWQWTPQNVSSLTVIVAELVIAIGFLFGARGLVGLVQKARRVHAD